MWVNGIYEEMLGSVHINEDTNERGTLLDIRPYKSGSVQNNWIAEEISVVFRSYLE